MQMAVTNTKYCDFVVWSPYGIYHMKRINISRDFIEQKFLQAEKLFWLSIMPELLGKWYTRKNTELPKITLQSAEEEEDDGTWCYCQAVKGGEMIACENPSCTIRLKYIMLLKSPIILSSNSFYFNPLFLKLFPVKSILLQ